MPPESPLPWLTPPASVEPGTAVTGPRRPRRPRPLSPDVVRRLVPFLTLLVVVAVVGSGGTFWLSRRGNAWPSHWDPRVRPIVTFVEKQRGLTFEHPVPIDFLAPTAFEQHVAGDKPLSAKDRADLEKAVGELRALGLVSGKVDLAALERKLLRESVIGLYDDQTHHVYVKGAELTPDVRVTLAHELTHALQDQRFGLRQLHGEDSGRASAYRALVEADAMRVEDAYTNALSPDDKKAYDSAQAADNAAVNLGDLPPVMVQQFSFPYVFGPYFLRWLLKSGGNAAVNVAFSGPPTSDAQVIDPASFLAGVKAVTVAAPKLRPGQVMIDKPDDFGQDVMLLVLGDRLGYLPAWTAVRAWAGDSVIGYRDHGRSCVAVATALRTPADADRFAGTATQWAATMPGASVTRAGATVELRSCDPGAAAAAHPPATPDPFHVLQDRAQLMQLLHEQAHLDGKLPGCVADNAIARMGPEEFVAVGEAPPNDPRIVSELGPQIRAASAACQQNPDL